MKINDIQRQENARNRAYDPAVRWQHILDRITWAEQHVVHRNTPASRVAEQLRHDTQNRPANHRP